ncbi:hypothetical protein SO802_014337, partial [Lithocarpus litseifolius]
MGPGHSHYLQALELSREIEKLFNCTSWSGVGPGLMHAATKGALQVGKLACGLKIGKEAGEGTASNFHLLLDAAVRSSSFDRIAVVALPGGIGTLDKLLDFLDDCEDWGTFPKGEVASPRIVCNINSEALAYLAEFNNPPLSDKCRSETEMQSICGAT